MPVLVATDVGSRGLDIPEVAMVVNWDCPREAEDYVHRVGRTARAGRGGVAVTMVTERDTELVGGIEKVISASFFSSVRRVVCSLARVESFVANLSTSSFAEATLTELVLPEAAVLEDLNKVSTAKRVAAMVSLSFLLLSPSFICRRRALCTRSDADISLLIGSLTVPSRCWFRREAEDASCSRGKEEEEGCCSKRLEILMYAFIFVSPRAQKV